MQSYLNLFLCVFSVSPLWLSVSLSSKQRSWFLLRALCVLLLCILRGKLLLNSAAVPPSFSQRLSVSPFFPIITFLMLYNAATFGFSIYCGGKIQFIRLNCLLPLTKLITPPSYHSSYLLRTTFAFSSDHLGADRYVGISKNFLIRNLLLPNINRT